MLMVKSLDCKLRASKTSASMSEALRIEKKKARKAIEVEQPLVVGDSGSSKHCQIEETDSSQYKIQVNLKLCFI
jgi:hypothetical protein